MWLIKLNNVFKTKPLSDFKAIVEADHDILYIETAVGVVFHTRWVDSALGSFLIDVDEQGYVLGIEYMGHLLQGATDGTTGEEESSQPTGDSVGDTPTLQE